MVSHFDKSAFAASALRESLNEPAINAKHQEMASSLSSPLQPSFAAPQKTLLTEQAEQQHETVSHQEMLPDHKVSHSILANLTSPREIAYLLPESLEQLACEVRELLVSTVMQTGGHLAPSLGVVELTLALLHVFDAKNDAVVWDVGHQAYAWKILTDRAAQFHTLRTQGGLSGFPKPAESPYDHFGVGHSSTSISAALGIATARDLRKESTHTIAVIGDGSLTGGMAFEGLNQAGHMNKRLIVILNDNEMSISENVGALSLFLSRGLSKKWVRMFKRDVESFLLSVPGIGEDILTYAKKSQRSFKNFFTPGVLFEAFNFNYIGPIDGHDLPELIKTLEMAKNLDRPILLHVLTKKGKGYAPAEANPSTYHGIGRCVLKTEKTDVVAPPSFTSIFSQTLCKLAEKDETIVAITAAMPSGTGTATFAKQFPHRFVDVGICEQHAVTFAAGLAIKGFKPVVGIYSTFLQRAYDQIVHDVCLQNLPVVFAVDRAGLVGEDGPTHHGVFDISYLRHIPNMHILAPRDENELQHALKTALALNAPCAVRYPRGAGFGVQCDEEMHTFAYGQGVFLQEQQTSSLEQINHSDKSIALIACGTCSVYALEAAQQFREETGIYCTVFDSRWIKPLPQEQLIALAKAHSHLLIIEENTRAGGFSSAILELFADNNQLNSKYIKRLGVPDSFVEHGHQKELREQIGIDSTGILQELRLLV